MGNQTESLAARRSGYQSPEGGGGETWRPGVADDGDVDWLGAFLAEAPKLDPTEVVRLGQMLRHMNC